LLVGWKRNNLHSVRVVGERGIKTIVDRGSADILYQRQIRKNEYKEYGVAPN